MDETKFGRVQTVLMALVMFALKVGAISAEEAAEIGEVQADMCQVYQAHIDASKGTRH